jgi:SAM-dependent methyltransferase
VSLENLEALFSNPNQLSRIRAEADFGLREIEGLVAALPAGSRVLDVGAGTGYLLARLAITYPTLEFTGVEPIGEGFSQFSQALDLIDDAHANITINREPIEDFKLPTGHGGYDLIYSVNVFEHLDDWQAGLDNSVSLLSPSGELVVLCPNYSFPYEPHFSIPVLGSASLTKRIFARKIRAVEEQEDCAGLWASLNFITVPAFARYAKSKGYVVDFDREIMARMLARLDDDKEFAKRQSGLAPFASALNRLGAGRLLSVLPAATSPYLKAIIRRK